MRGKKTPLLAELTAMVALVLIELWLPVTAGYEPWRWTVRVLAAGLWIVSYRRWQATRDPVDHPREVHPRNAHPRDARRAWRETWIATTIVAVGLIAWVAAISEPYETPTWPLLSPMSAAATWIARRIGLAALQQVVLQLFVWRLLRQVVRHEPTAVLLAATIFGLFHLPSWPLTIATFLAALVWIGLFRRHRRLAPLIVSHALLAGLASIAVPERLFYDMQAGAVAKPSLATYRQLADPKIRSLLRDLTSADYLTHHEGTVDGYVAGLYRDVLGRPATDDEIAASRNWITNPEPSSRARLAKTLVTSPEAHLRHRSPRQIRLDFEPLPPRTLVTADSLQGDGWYGAEQGWRWASGDQPTIDLQVLADLHRAYLLELSSGGRAPQTVTLMIDDHPLGNLTFDTLTPQSQRLTFDGALLAATEAHELHLSILGDRIVDTQDSRPLGLGFRSLEIAPLRFPSVAVTHVDDPYFLNGFSAAEQNLRWSQASVARLVYPLRTIDASRYAFELLAGAFGQQRVNVRVNEHNVAHWRLDGLTPQHRLIEFDSAMLRPGINRIELHLPDAQNTESDPRRLGIAFVSARIYPAATD